MLWFDAFRSSGLPGDTILPFLENSVSRRFAGWENSLLVAYETSTLKAGAISIILRFEGIPESFRRRALRDAYYYPDLAANLIFFDQVSQSVTVELFKHDDKSFVGQLALELWRREEQNVIPNWIRDQWQHAILDYTGEDHWLELIFAKETDLAKRWMEHKLRDNQFEPYKFEQSMSCAVASMSITERKSLLEKVPNEYKMHQVVETIVGDDVDLFQKLMTLRLNNYVALSPLGRGSIDSVWLAFAQVAYDHCHDAQTIAGQAFAGVVFSGSYLDLMKNQYEQFEAIRDHESQSIREIAEAGYQTNYRHYQDFLNQEENGDSLG